MNDINTKVTTVAIMSNIKCVNNNVDNNCTYSVHLDPIMLTLDTFKKAFFPFNNYAPNEFIEISKFNYYNVSKRTIQNGNCNTIDCCGNTIDCCGNAIDCSDNAIIFYDNVIDCNDSAIECSNNECVPLSLYQEILSMFMSYNNILNENAINPNLLITFSNNILNYNNFKDVPKVINSLSWVKILNWLTLNESKEHVLTLEIVFYYYDLNFMPYPVKFIFSYFIC
tara:strand:+ start:1598 stop:2272 length:675 start_codon:yes stop_codon:yes gene_type:complete